MAKNGDNKAKIVVIRRNSGGGSAHHGGAWKIAYADFVTAMMAFFLVMWLINATTEQRRRGIANFFNPMSSDGAATAHMMAEPSASTVSGNGSVQGAKNSAGSRTADLLPTSDSILKKSDEAATVPRGLAPGNGGVPARSGGFGPDVGVVMGRDIAGAGQILKQSGTIRAPVPSFPDRSIGMVTPAPAAIPRIVPIGGEKNGVTTSVGDGQDAAQQEQEDLESDARQMKAALAQDPVGAQAAQQLAVHVTPEGLQIEISETEKKPMFDSGSARLNVRAAHLLGVIAPYLTAMPQTLSIYGYTDGAIFRTSQSSNWTLSGARADSARSVLTQNGFPERRLVEVAGRADRELALPDDPGAAANRRIVLVLHREHDVQLPGAGPAADTTPSTSGNPASDSPAQPGAPP